MKTVLAAVSIAPLLVSASAFALTFNGSNMAGDGVLLSKHNMLKYAEISDTDGEGRVCAFCHTPHHAITSTNVNDYLPLWSHQLLDTTQRSNYTAYQSSTFNTGDLALQVDPLAGSTIICMSCHDGIIAVDQHYGNSLGVNRLTDDNFGSTEALGGGSQIGRNFSLSNDHPVGFSYTEYQRRRPHDLRPADSTYFAGTKTGKTIASQLGPNGLMTCASCHDVHNRDSVQNDYGGASKTRNFFLLGNNNGSQLCLTCHIK